MSDTPEFGGKCAFGTALGGPQRAPQGKAKYALHVDGKTYYFAGAVPRFLFKTLHLAKKADSKGA